LLYHSTALTWQAVRGTKVVWLVVGVITAAQIAITYWPALQTVFATESVPFWDGVLVIAIGAVMFVILESQKQIRLRLWAVNRLTGVKASG
jgi:uncharacterized membrane protein